MSTFQHFEVGWTSTYGQYIPPDFNPAIMDRHKSSKKRNSDGFAVRNMLPFTVVCVKCGQHMARGTKFNMRGERMLHNEYLGQKNVLFTFHCSGCSKKCQFRTDYEHSTYEVVTGCFLNNEPFKRAVKEERKTQQELEDENAMQRLERITEQLKTSSQMQEQVDDLIHLNKRKGSTNTDKLRNVLNKKRDRNEFETEEEAVRLNDRERKAFREKRLKMEAEASDKPKKTYGFFGAPPKKKPRLDPTDSDKKEEPRRDALSEGAPPPKPKAVGVVKVKVKKAKSADGKRKKKKKKKKKKVNVLGL